ncbi:FAD-dependent oxidoreductase [Amycolatopsis sp. NPDC059021]|uniref:FAD-dependent oxidoreductase n=1 Tax=Amycolatopsis sp. NPDC059021 TaxID=3346704 RepID=UPI00366C28BA
MGNEHRRGAGQRVLVIGGGIGGLCLAQGLRQAGIDVSVHERDTSARGRNQGYRLRISPEGEQALRACLPPRLRDLLVATSHARQENGLAAYNERLVPQWSPEFDDPRGDAPDKIDAVDRVTLRGILLAGLDDIVHYGRRFVRCAHEPDGRVTAYFADGSTETGDLLVAADGTGSAVRAQLRPADQPRDLGVRTVFSRIPMDEKTDAIMPDVLRNRFSYVIGEDGNHLGLMPMVFRTPPSAAAARLCPEARLADSGNYYMSVFNVHQRELGISDERLFAMSGTELCELVLERTRGWHPALHETFTMADPRTAFAIPLRATTPVTPWEPGVVVPLGDAIHAMPPSGGVGANTAARDAMALCSALTGVARGERSLPEALARYQADMAGYATEAVTMSLRIAQWSMKRVDVEVEAG